MNIFRQCDFQSESESDVSYAPSLPGGNHIETMDGMEGSIPGVDYVLNSDTYIRNLRRSISQELMLTSAAYRNGLPESCSIIRIDGFFVRGLRAST